MGNLGWDINYYLVIPLVGGTVLVGIVFYYSQQYFRLKNSLDKMLKNFRELDEQAKLIVKTDLELNKAQEELDKRFNGLDALQKISRLVSTTLIEKEIFQRLNQPLLAELGFENYLIIMWDSLNNPACRVNRNFPEERAAKILNEINGNAQLLSFLKEKHIVSHDQMEKEKPPLTRIPLLKKFVMAPILNQSNILGVILAGGESVHFIMGEAEKELIAILADQIGQAVRNARLFEEVYMSHQNLELKINERTKELTKALEEVQRINKMKTEFISAVSHELRTPLTSIKGYASILMAGKVGEIPPQVKDRLKKINKHSDNLVKMINDLLDIARIESGRAVMQRTQQSLKTVIDNIKDLLAPQIKEKEIALTTDIPADTPEVMMDIAQIERVFINLVSNAIKFTPQKGTIGIQVSFDEGKITVAVKDSGIGIKETDMGRLFEEFYRAENIINQNVKGTGLGLSLAKNIIEAHHGEIRVASTVGEGTTFTFTLPRK